MLRSTLLGLSLVLAGFTARAEINQNVFTPTEDELSTSLVEMESDLQETNDDLETLDTTRLFNVVCESWNYRYNFCPVRGRVHSVWLVRQLSDTRCVHGYNWGYDRRGIAVDNGCRAIFRVQTRGGRRW